MATAKGIAKMSKIFDQAYEKPIDEEAYPLWLEDFRDVDDEDLRKAALSLSKNRDQYMRGLVTPDEITRELQYIGIPVHRRKEDPAFVAANAVMEERYRKDSEMKGVSLAEFSEANEGMSKVIQSYLKGRKDV